MNRERFASKMYALAQDCAEKFRINPAIIASQACLETGYGKSILSKKANNLFGLYAGPYWKGLKYPMKNRQFLHAYGWSVKISHYRLYSTWLDCITNYSEILCCELSLGVDNCEDPIAYLDDLCPKAEEGLSVTDPRYREKILSIAKIWKWI